MPASLAGWGGEVPVHVQERRPGDVAGEVELPAPNRRPELPAAVDELVVHGSIVTGPAGGGVSEPNPERSQS
jgi:hypothetical protein